jgi:hypothetical protein
VTIITKEITMELNEIMKYIQNFGLLPFITIYMVVYWQKNNQKIIDQIGQRIVLYIQSSEQSKPLDKMILKKDLNILELTLKIFLKDIIEKIIELYKSVGNGRDRSLQPFGEGIINKVRDESYKIDYISTLDIDRNIKERYKNKLQRESQEIFFRKVENAITINGTNLEMLKELIQQYANECIDTVITDLEAKLL